MLDVGGAIGRERQRRLFSAASLNTGLFVCADDVIHRHPVKRPPRHVGKDRGRVQLLRQSTDREERSSFDVSRGEGHRC